MNARLRELLASVNIGPPEEARKRPESDQKPKEHPNVLLARQDVAKVMRRLRNDNHKGYINVYGDRVL